MTEEGGGGSFGGRGLGSIGPSRGREGISTETDLGSRGDSRPQTGRAVEGLGFKALSNHDLRHEGRESFYAAFSREG